MPVKCLCGSSMFVITEYLRQFWDVYRRRKRSCHKPGSKRRKKKAHGLAQGNHKTSRPLPSQRILHLPTVPHSSPVCSKAQLLAFCLSSTPQIPGNSQAGLTHYKRGCLPPPPSLAPPLFPFLSLSLHVLMAMACLYFPTLSPSLCLSLPLLPS